MVQLHDNDAVAEAGRTRTTIPILKLLLSINPSNYRENKTMSLSPSHGAHEVYELCKVWPGKNKPLCGGRCFRGPDPGIWMLTLTLTIGVPVLFFIEFYENTSWGILIPIAILVVCVVIAFLKASLMEPGILPRRKEWNERPEDPPTVEVCFYEHIHTYNIIYILCLAMSIHIPRNEYNMTPNDS